MTAPTLSDGPSGRGDPAVPPSRDRLGSRSDQLRGRQQDRVRPVHPDLLALENVVLTPHVGSASRATRIRTATTAAENCIAALQGHRPPNLVNAEAWRER